MQKILKISQQTLWQLVAKFASIISGFLILGIVTRSYSEAGSGHFTLALTYLGLFYVLADFTLNAHILHDLTPDSWRKFLGTRIIWSGLLIFLLLIILLALPANFSHEFKIGVLLGSISVFFYGLNMTVGVYFQKVLKYEYDILPTILSVVAGSLTTLYLSSIGAPIYLMVLGYVVMWFVHGGGSYLYLLKIIKNIRPIFDLSFSLKLFQEVWPMAASLVLNMVYFRADAFILSYYQPIAQVGLYNVAYQVFQVVLVFPTLIMNSFYPYLLDSVKSGKNFSPQVKIAILGLLLISLMATGIFVVGSPQFIRLITGGGFQGSITALRILSLGFPAFFLSSLGLLVMMSKKMYKQMLLVYGLGLVFNLVANLIFIPTGSYPAAAWITGVSEYLILTLQLIVLAAV